MKKAKNRRHLLPVLVLLGLLAAFVIPSVITARSMANETTGPEAKVERLVLDQLAAESETDFFVWMTEKADLSPAAALKTKEEKGQFVFDTLRATAESTQKELRDYLDAQGISYRPFYIANKIYVESGNLEAVMSIAAREDVAQITANHAFQLQEPFINPDAVESVEGIESNIAFVNADDVWALGYDGSGTVMAGNDTGLDWDHPALINQYRGWNGSTADHNYNWWDATGTYPMVPDDGHGHGTHTTGTMVGDDGGSNQIGVAPGAQTVHCKNMTNGGSGSDLTFSECFEWDLAPWDLSGANPQPSLAPDAVNNSWGYFGGNAPQFEDEIVALRAAGIVVEVSAGNEGSGCGTLRSPGDYVNSLTTGSVNHFGTFPGTITGFSSRGPSALYPSDYIPEIMAPGESINSSLPGGGYSGPTWSGTSMAGPHVTALVALMWEASPNIAGDVALTEQIIVDTAVPLTGQGGSNCGGDYTNGPNNDWGFGTMDALAAVQMAIALGGPFGVSATPESLDICTPTNGIFNVDVTLNEAFTDPVNLTATGHPGGTTATFSPNNQVPPFSSVLTIGNTGAASAGSYDIEIEGTSGSESASDTVELNVFTATPGAVTLVAPANGASNVVLVPEFEWTAATQGSTYELEVADDAGFSNVVYSATVEGTTHVATTALEPETEYFWRVTPENTCGAGSASSTFSFTTRAVPPILVVDDDNNNPDVRSYYTDALDALGQAYDVWDTNNSDNEPSAAELAPYSTVIWFTGVAFGGTAGPGGTGEAALATWLDAGQSCMFISSQDYLYDRGKTPFLDTYLGVDTFTSDVAQTTVTGAGSVFSGLGPYSLSFPFSNYSDMVSPDGAPAELAFSGSAGNAAVNKDTGVYRTTFWGFPYEAISAAADRQAVMTTVLNWCGALGETGTLEGTVTDADTSNGIEGATVSATGPGNFSTQTDANGDYSMALPVGTYDVTASADNYVPETVTNIEIITGTTEIQDFVLQGSSLTYSPDEIEEFMELGDVVSNTVTVTNTGPLDIDWSVSFSGFGPPTVVLPASDGNFATGSYAASAGAPPVDGKATGPTDAPLVDLSLLGSSVYGFNAAVNQYTIFDLDVPEVLPSIAVISPGSEFINAGEYVDGSVYMLGNGNTIWELDPATGAVLDTYTATPPSGGQTWSSMALDPTSGVVYAGTTNVAASSLYTIDLTTGAATLVGPISISPGLIGLAADGAGNLYGYDLVTDMLISIDKNTGVGTNVGSIGFDANFGQGMFYDPATDTVYMVAFNNSAFQAELRAVDTSTGNTTFLGVLGQTTPGGLNQLGWAAVELSTGANWAYAVPNSGTVPANSSATFEVVFDATSLIELGTYTAEMEFSGTFVNDVPPMPLTMHLSCPSCGVLDGSITDAVTGDPLEADINITDGVFDVTVSGDSYNVAVQPGTYDITVSADDYISQTETVTVAAGETVTTDFALLPIFSELDYMPDYFEATLGLGGVVTHSMTISNLGTVAFDFTLKDVEIGSPLSSAPVMYPLGSVEFSEPAAVGPASVRSAEGRAALEELETPMAWANGAPLPSTLVRYAHAQCAEEPDSFYIIAGVSDGNIIGNTRRYDATTDSWTELAPLPVPQEGPSGVCLEGYIYVAGGGGTTQFYIYDIANNSWSAGPALPRAVWGAAMGAYDGNVYMIGGDSDFFFGGTSTAVNIYDVAGGTWSTGASMPTGAVTAGSVQAGQYVYVVGGWGDASPAANVDVTQRYDMSSDTWEVGPTFTSGRADFALAVTTANLYAIGGDANGGGAFDASAVVESLDHTAWPGGSWTDIGDPLSPPLTANNAGFCTTAMTGGEVWSVGGIDPGFVFRNINQYRAAEPCFAGGAQDALWLHETPDSGTVEAGETMDISIVFDASVITTTGTYTAEIIFNGTYDNQVERATAVLHVVDEAEYGVSMSGDMAASGDAGETVVYTVTVTNEGNVDDTFNLALSGETWTSTLSDPSVTLGPGESATVTVEVEIPGDAADGDTDTVTITATSANDPSATASANLTTTAVVEADTFTMFLPIMLKQP